MLICSGHLGQRPLPRKNLKNKASTSTVKRTVHNNPPLKRSFSKMLFQPEEIENAGFSLACTQAVGWSKKTEFVMRSRG